MKTTLLLALFAMPVIAQNTVRYELSFPNAAHHEAEVEVTFTEVRRPVLEVVMSRSSPGRYALHEFAKNVYNVRAADPEGHPLKIDRPSPYQWNVSAHHGTVVFSYTVFGDRADGTYAAIDSTHAHLNTPAVLAWAHGYEKIPASVKLTPPPDSKWTADTQLVLRPDGTYNAPNLDRLMDGPIEFSEHSAPEWIVGNAHFRLSLHHQGTEAETQAFARICQAIVTEEEGVFGGFPKFDGGTYTFLIDLLPYVGFDGMEHRNSTVITEATSLHEAEAAAAGTPAHEFFHSWNVKRIRPADLEPFNFEQANMSGELWFAEGFTSYYGPLALRRAGILSDDKFFEEVSAPVNTVINAPGRLVSNVVDMSRQAVFVDAARSVDPTNTRNTFISYYTYGAALGLGLDLEIRARFPGKSLDDWMRTMWRDHPDSNKPYTLDDLEKGLGKATDSTEFAKIFFDRHIYGKEPLDYSALLDHAGLALEPAAPLEAWIGNPKVDFSDRGAVLTDSSLRGSPLYKAGIDRGDRIISVDGHVIKSESDLTSAMKIHKPGDLVHLKVETRTGKVDLDVTSAPAPGLHIVTYEQSGRTLTPEMIAFRSAWLSSKAIHPLPKLQKYCPKCGRALPFEYTSCPFDGKRLALTSQQSN